MLQIEDGHYIGQADLEGLHGWRCVQRPVDVEASQKSARRAVAPYSTRIGEAGGRPSMHVPFHGIAEPPVANGTLEHVEQAVSAKEGKPDGIPLAPAYTELFPFAF
jgi:hypothetical protein